MSNDKDVIKTMQQIKLCDPLKKIKHKKNLSTSSRYDDK